MEKLMMARTDLKARMPRGGSYRVGSVACFVRLRHAYGPVGAGVATARRDRWQDLKPGLLEAALTPVQKFQV